MKRKIVLSFLLLIGLVACNLAAAPGGGATAGPTTNPQILVQTAVAQTVEVQTQLANAVQQTLEVQTQLANAVQQTLKAMVTDTPQYTLTPSLTVTPSLTYTPSLTITPTFTLTVAVPMVSVSVETNCRSGPGTAYDIRGVLQVGQVAEVVGRSASSDNWIIKLPSKPSVTCWVWGQYATVTGDTSKLPVIVPPPTPTSTVNFILTYDSFTSCGVSFGIKFKIVNNGSMTWESNQVNVTDKTTSVTKTINRDFFTNFNGCVVVANDSNLDPGEVGITTSNAFADNPTGHDFSATIQVCAQNGQGGPCLAKTITFTP